MDFFTWLTTKRKTLATMSATELRSQEMLMENERNRLLTKMNKLSREKQEIINKGAKEKTPEMRRAMAQQFDLLHTEQMMTARHLNIRSKELITVARLRMLRESSERARGVSATGVQISQRDLMTIQQLVENEQISMEAYQQRLDQILELSRGEEDFAATGMSPAAEELMRIWDDMDHGLVKDDQALDETERRVRERQRASDG